ncbi:hypothetical protein [uncultured Campylobacter sp.]
MPQFVGLRPYEQIPFRFQSTKMTAREI